MALTKSLGFQIVLILSLALCLRLGAGVWWQRGLPQGKQFRFGDSESYWLLGQGIAHGEPFEYGEKWLSIFRTPGYPIMLAGLFRLTGDDPPVWCARALSAVLGTMAVGAVMWLTWLLFDIRIARLAGLLAALYPGGIALGVLVLAEAPFCPLMVLHLIGWTVAYRAKKSSGQGLAALLGGACAGAATLMRPSWLLFTPFALLIAIAFFQHRRRQLWVGAAMLAGLCIVMSPWWVRNWQVSGRFVPTTLQVGASLYDGLNPRATGASDMYFINDFVRQQHQDKSTGPLTPRQFEVHVDRRLRRAAIEWARENPGRAAQLAGIKFVRMWNVLPNASELGSLPMRIAMMLGYTPLIVLGVVGSIRYARRGWPYALCFLPAVYFTLLHVVFVSSIRYRQPAMLTIIVLAAAALGMVLRPSPRKQTGLVN